MFSFFDYLALVDAVLFKLIFAYERSQQTKRHLLENYELFVKYNYVYTDYNAWMAQIARGESQLRRIEYKCERKLVEGDYFEYIGIRDGWKIVRYLNGLAKSTPGGLLYLRRRWLAYVLSGLSKEMLG